MGFRSPMQPKTEEFLFMLLWTLDTAMRPTFRNLDASFEEWAYCNGFQRQIHKLEAEGYLQQHAQSGRDARVYRLTERGRLHALGGRDPESEWSAVHADLDGRGASSSVAEQSRLGSSWWK